jgi:methionyl-tRNA formyltransferase
VTIFWPDDGWDTGPVLLQREVAIGPDDTTGSLYYDKLYNLGIDLLVESVGLVKAGKAPRIAQDESQATFEKGFSDRDARLDWSKPGVEVYRLVRGADPSPGAWSRLRERRVRLLDARLEPEASSEPGVVAAVDESGVLVGTAAGALRFRKIGADDTPVGPANDAARSIGIKPGDRFQ